MRKAGQVGPPGSAAHLLLHNTTHVQQWQRLVGKASDVDFAVNFATYAAGRVPALGMVASSGQLVYDLASPVLPW